MKKISLLYVCLVVMLLSTGCSSKLMQTVDVQNVAQTIPDGKASVTFFRSSSFGGMIQAPIAVKKDENLELVGISSTDTKIHHVVEPGEYTYVVAGEGGMAMRAIVSADKHYYVRIEPRAGFWKANFAFVPISNIDILSEDIQEELADCDYVIQSPDAQAWFTENKASMEEKLSEALLDKNEAILPALYGIDKLN